jgi:putative ABC transport system permease protein
MYRDLWAVPDNDLARWNANRTGAIVGQQLADRFGWTIGTRLPLKGTMWLKRGGGAWEFTIDGIYQAGPASGRDASLNLMFFHYAYLNDTRTLGVDSWIPIAFVSPSRSAPTISHG